ncbi:MAG: bifunctional UDP-N-acetylmuramoyl-tripeptide:D-alanyl-D-alanine ligase/alanine racemase [Bacteroidales bacterium]|nr:bifunctional UDP-N-acetylmuramoyl-tripeptide:D-alanyl-D-alanine ligase/alanine racemase [Bacteroidales bacterium]
MALKIQDIHRIIGGELIGDSKEQISHFIIDSRRYIPNESVLFFAITGERNDGHKYISDLVSKGVRHFVVENLPDSVSDLSLSFIQVDNTLKALQHLAASIRSEYEGQVVGITGSNGKTILKEWIYQSLSDFETVHRSPQSYNSQVGVPLSIFHMNNDSSYWILEAGISLSGEMKKLELIIKPRIGIFTNIGEAHQENFNSIKEKIQEKLKLFENSESLIYCANNTLIAEEVSKLSQKQSRVSWGRSNSCDYIFSEENDDDYDLIVSGRKEGRFRIKFTDSASKENISHLIVFLFENGFEQKNIQQSLDKLEPVGMRMEIIKATGNSTIINDAYNSDLISLENALDYLAAQNQHSSKTLILSDILQSGKEFNDLLYRVEGLISVRKINRKIFIGEEFYRNRELIQEDTIVYSDTDSFLNDISEIDFLNEAILLKGSRKYEFERIAEILQEKNHRTILEINLHALVENYRFYRSLIKPEVKVMAMVKAFSYGSGGYEVASVLEYNNIDYLAVAYADEGVELRKRGIKLPLMVMSPEIHDFNTIIKYNLEPELYSLRILKEFKEFLKRYAINDWPVHLKIDTGMHRLGFEKRDIPVLIESLKGSKCRIISVFSHLSAAEDKKHDTFTKKQISDFVEICDIIKEETGNSFIRHILNSPGIERFPEASFEMVRLGIGLYGLSQNYKNNLKEVSSFKTRISQIKELNKDETIGYGRNGRLKQKTRVATLPVGYADGIPRSLGNGKGEFYINNNPVHTIGNICMDMLMVDLTGIDANEGDEVVIFGENHSVNKIAKSIGTISYEVLTNISQRVKRVYFQE